jgi:hypothetical protein
MGRVQRNVLGILLAGACGVLLACHHSGGAALIKRHAKVAAVSSAAELGPADLVAAVSLGGSGEGAVSLKFQLGQRPMAGQPVDIVLRLVANQPLEHLEARFHTDDGLDIPQGSDFDPEGHMDPGSAIEHRLTVVAAHEGVYTVMATVTNGTAADAVSHSFVIPIVFGPAAPAGPAGDAAAAKAP